MSQSREFEQDLLRAHTLRSALFSSVDIGLILILFDGRKMFIYMRQQFVNNEYKMYVGLHTMTITRTDAERSSILTSNMNSLNRDGAWWEGRGGSE